MYAKRVSADIVDDFTCGQCAEPLSSYIDDTQIESFYTKVITIHEINGIGSMRKIFK